MPDGLVYDTLRPIFHSLPTARFFVISSSLSALLLLARRVKPVASCVLALSVPGTIGAALTFLLTAGYKLYVSSADLIHLNLILSLLVVIAFPSYVVSPVIFFFSFRRYFSTNKEDYAIGFGVISVTAVLIASVVISDLLIRS